MNDKPSSVFQRGDSDEDRVGRFVAGSSVTMMATVVSGALSFVWTILMQRLLGPGGYGIIKPFIDVFWILSTAVSFGIPQAMSAWISRSHAESPQESSLAMAEGKSLLSGIGAIFLFVSALLLALFSHRMEPLTIRLGWLMIVAVLGRQMYFAMFGILGGVQRLDMLAVCNLVFPSAMLASSTLLVMYASGTNPGSAGGDAGVIAGAAGVAIATCLQYAVSLGVINRVVTGLKELFSWRRCRAASIRRMLSYGWLAAVAMMCGAFMTFVPTPVVSNIAHSFQVFGSNASENALQAGYFSSAYTYAMAPMLIVGMVYAILPAISEAYKQNNLALMQEYFDLSIKYAGIVIGMILTVYTAFSGHIVVFFSGPEFPAETVGALTLILAVGMSACMLAMLCCNLLLGIDRPGIPAAVLAFSLVLEIGLIACAGFLSGSIYSVAAVFDAAVLCGLALLIYYIKKAAGLRFRITFFVPPAFASVATSLAAGTLPADGPVFLLWICVAIMVYFLLLGLGGGYGPADVAMLRNTIRSTPAAPLDRLAGAAEALLAISPLYSRQRKPE